MKYFLSFFIAIFLSFLFSPILLSLGWDYKYDYNYFDEKIKISHEGSEFFLTHTFSSPRTTLIVGFDPEDIDRIGAENIHVEWKIGTRTILRDLDIGDDGSDPIYTTFPVIIPSGADHAVFRIVASGSIDSVHMISFDLRPKFSGMSFSPDHLSTYAESDEPRIIRRSEWGADETYRYVSESYRQKEIDEWKARGQKPRIIYETQEERTARLRIDTEVQRIRASDIDNFTIQTIQYYENGHKLLYPTRTTKKVNKIILHHTAEDMNTTLDDATLVRNIYAYHARVKGWGDIGYQYLVGQRGMIYEGRTGGDYVEGINVYGNNLGIVGVSVIGNYDQNHLNKDQKQGIIQIVTYLARKYGIDPSGTALGMKKCGSSESCAWKQVMIPAIAAHRDLGITNCPGQNLYEYLPEIRKNVIGKVGKVYPIYNPAKKNIEQQPFEDQATYELASKKSPIVPSLQIAKSTVGQIVKIGLSYSGSSITLDSPSPKQPIAKVGLRKVASLKQENIKINTYGTDQLQISIGMKSYTGRIFSLEGDIVRVTSWERIPSWDVSKKYNDNLFRGKLIVRNDHGKIVLVNELPVEDYLRGMGEVSESDAKLYPEKVKALIVSARSYVLYYANPKLPSKDRKFPGKPYDISDNPDESQQYKGYSYELRSPTVASLVSLTRGEVVTQGGKILKVPYSQSPGRGKTYSYLEYCTERGGKNCADISYLQSVDDPGATGTTRSGHGYGVSGVGSAYFDRQGWDYKKILTYYLTGVEIQKK